MAAPIGSSCRTEGVAAGLGGRNRTRTRARLAAKSARACEGGHRVARHMPVKPVCHGQERGSGAGDGGYETGATVGVGMRLGRWGQLLLVWGVL